MYKTSTVCGCNILLKWKFHKYLPFVIWVFEIPFFLSPGVYMFIRLNIHTIYQKWKFGIICITRHQHMTIWVVAIDTTVVSISKNSIDTTVVQINSENSIDTTIVLIKKNNSATMIFLGGGGRQKILMSYFSLKLRKSK